MTEVEQSNEVEISQIVAKYIEIRSKRESLLRDYEAIDEELKEELKQFEAQLLDACTKIGANSISTAAGTVIRNMKERFYCTDWDNFYKFIAEHDAPQLLEKRIHQSNFKEFYEPNEADGLPPGVNVMREFGITVRKPSK
jgi:hypothetical protein